MWNKQTKQYKESGLGFLGKHLHTQAAYTARGLRTQSLIYVRMLLYDAMYVIMYDIMYDLMLWLIKFLYYYYLK